MFKGTVNFPLCYTHESAEANSLCAIGMGRWICLIAFRNTRPMFVAFTYPNPSFTSPLTLFRTNFVPDVRVKRDGYWITVFWANTPSSPGHFICFVGLRCYRRILKLLVFWNAELLNLCKVFALGGVQIRTWTRRTHLYRMRSTSRTGRHHRMVCGNLPSGPLITYPELRTRNLIDRTEFLNKSAGIRRLKLRGRIDYAVWLRYIWQTVLHTGIISVFQICQNHSLSFNTIYH